MLSVSRLTTWLQQHGSRHGSHVTQRHKLVSPLALCALGNRISLLGHTLSVRGVYCLAVALGSMRVGPSAQTHRTAAYDVMPTRQPSYLPRSILGMVEARFERELLVWVSASYLHLVAISAERKAVEAGSARRLGPRSRPPACLLAGGARLNRCSARRLRTRRGTPARSRSQSEA